MSLILNPYTAGGEAGEGALFTLETQQVGSMDGNGKKQHMKILVGLALIYLKAIGWRRFYSYRFDNCLSHTVLIGVLKIGQIL